jgi:hypothetical protein
MIEELLAIAGLGGLALLLTQAKPLPTEADYKKALDKIATAPDDPDANTIVGKYLAFVTGNYDEGLKYLEKSGDATLKTLAMHERAPEQTDTGPKKIGMADEWVAAAKKFPALFRVFYDRAAYWYILAWPDLDPVWKGKAREQGVKLSASRPPGTPKGALPTGWSHGSVGDKVQPSLDGTIAHVGSYSGKLPPKDPASERVLYFMSPYLPVQGKMPLEATAFWRSDLTEGGNDTFFVHMYDENKTHLGSFASKVAADQPFWAPVSTKGDLLPNAKFVTVGFIKQSKPGTLWGDDFSVKIGGAEILKNGSLEQK